MKRCLSGEAVNYETSLIFPAKGTRLLDVHYDPHIGNNGSVDGIVINVRDITERKQAEEALTTSEIKFRTLFDSTNDAVMVFDEERLIDANKATLRLFRCSTLEEFCTKTVADRSPREQPCGTNSLTLAKQQIALANEKGSNHFEWMHKRLDTGEIF